MTPADPVWLVAELLAALARAFRAHRERLARKWAAGGASAATGGTARGGLETGANFPPAEPPSLPDPLYARVQAALLDLACRRAAGRSAAWSSAPSAPVARSARSLSWLVQGREVTVHEGEKPLFRAAWSAREGGWRLFWSRTPGRWWPYAPMTHLTWSSFERCVAEVERDTRGCFLAEPSPAAQRGRAESREARLAPAR